MLVDSTGTEGASMEDKFLFSVFAAFLINAFQYSVITMM